MTHLKAFPTTETVRALMSAEELAAKVAAMSDYRTKMPIASFSESLSTPALLRAWAILCEAIQEVYPDAKLGKDLSISRSLTVAEREEIVLADEASRRYYHPEEYPQDYSEEDIKS